MCGEKKVKKFWVLKSLGGSFCSAMRAKDGCLWEQGAAVLAGNNYYFPYNLSNLVVVLVTAIA